MISGSTINQGLIVDAAIRRFSHFGISKTTLSEIAGDLNMSKPSLFYYFNDKDSLIIAVLEKLILEFHNSLRERLSGVSSAEEGVLKFIEAKHDFFKKNMQLAIQSGNIRINRDSPKVLKVMIKAKQETVNILCQLINKGIKNGELHPMDTPRITRLIVETLQLGDASLKNKFPIPTTNEIKQLTKTQKELVTLFFNGLKNHENHRTGPASFQ